MAEAYFGQALTLLYSDIIDGIKVAREKRYNYGQVRVEQANFNFTLLMKILVTFEGEFTPQ